MCNCYSGGLNRGGFTEKHEKEQHQKVYRKVSRTTLINLDMPIILQDFDLVNFGEIIVNVLLV